MKTIAALVIAVLAISGCVPVETDGTGGGSGTSTTGAGGGGGAGGSALNRACDGMAPGYVCGGDSKEPIHGECSEGGACAWKDWTCAHGEIGDVCQGGRCTLTANVGESAECCNACVATSGWCNHSLGQWGGDACK